MRFEKGIAEYLRGAVQVQQRLLDELEPDLIKASQIIVDAFENGKKLLLCGNGGSAGQAQHIAAEFTGRYLRDRKALPAISLTTDTSNITAIGNEYGFERVFERQVEALGREGDVLLALSTSGNSPNVLRAVEMANKKEMKTICLTGLSGITISEKSDLALVVSSEKTPHIQEAHIVMLHAVCGAVEATIFPE